jgi:surfeit locus 1 family protein
MTSEARRFPIGLTIAAATLFAIMCGLGMWQLQRAAWRDRELARIAALTHASPRPVGPVLAAAAGGADVSFARVEAQCAPAAPAPAAFHMVTDRGDWIARTLGACRLPVGAYDGLVVDRGFLEASRGSPNPPTLSLPAPGEVVGVLYPQPAGPALGLAHPAPYVLAVERETPPAPGVRPAPYPGGASESFQYVGAYAPTWFGLAGVLACVYAAMLWRRYHPKA